MLRKGNCHDNSIMENFFGLLKQEIYYGVVYYSYEKLKSAIEKYIVQSFDYKYTNGFTKGTNNTIKVIKRVGYGYRNFENFRKRIMMIPS